MSIVYLENNPLPFNFLSPRGERKKVRGAPREIISTLTPPLSPQRERELIVLL